MAAMSNPAPEAEEAIRRYLTFLDDPSKLRDEGEVQRRTVAVLEAQDPIEKLKALALLEKASAIDDQALRVAFVAAAKAWADEHGVSVKAFRELGVPVEVLTEAGFEVPPDARRRTARTAVTGEGGERRRTGVTSAVIKEATLTFTEPFTIAEVMAKAGGSPLTVRKAVEDLVKEGTVERRGPVPGYAGRGRAPIQYVVVSW